MADPKDANLVSGQGLSAEQMAAVVAEQDANLERGYALDASPASFAAAGQDAALNHDTDSNMPAGFFVDRTHNFEGPLESEDWWEVGHNSPVQATVIDAGSYSFYRRTYPAGLIGGRGTEFIATTSGPPNFTSLPAGTIALYYSFEIRYSNGWQTHASNVNKICYFGDTGNELFLNSTSGGAFEIRLQDAVTGRPYPGSNRNFRVTDPDNALDIPGAQRTPIPFDGVTWNRVEGLCYANDHNTQNGQLHLWVDGSKYMEFDSSLKHLAPGIGAKSYTFFENKDVNSWKNDSIWGGTGDSKNNTEWMDMRNIVIGVFVE